MYAYAPALVRELRMELGVDSEAAHRNARYLRGDTGTEALAGTTLADLRHAVETSIAGELRRDLGSVRRVAQSDDDAVRWLIRTLHDAKNSSVCRAQRHGCLGAFLARLGPQHLKSVWTYLRGEDVVVPHP